MTVRVAVETVAEIGSAALAIDEKLVGERTFGYRRHAALLLPSIVDLLQEQSLHLRDVDEIILADGPGSFTGIRIGFSTVAGITAIVPAAVFVASSMTGCVVASDVPRQGSIAVLHDALRGDVYAALYSRNESSIRIQIDPHVTTLEGFRDALSTTPDIVLTDSAGGTVEEVRSWSGRPPQYVQPAARNLLILRSIEGGVRLVKDLHAFSPTYGRLAEAQVRWELKHGRPLSDTPR